MSGPVPCAGQEDAGRPALPRPVLVLASASPARLATLRSAGIAARVMVSGVDEDHLVAQRGLQRPADIAVELARAKALDVAGRVSGALVLGCDSVLELDGLPHGKPADPAQAAQRWRQMRGRSAVLHTGHHVQDTSSGRGVSGLASTVVHFAEVDDEEIAAYVGTGEPLRVAGAFTIDGLGGPFVEGVEGDHHNVVGLSLPLLRRLLAQLGWRITALWAGQPNRPLM